MPAPLFNPPSIPDGLPGWNNRINEAMDQVKVFLRTAPSQCRQVYRVSANNPDTSRFLNLNGQSAATYTGWKVWVLDAAGDANNPSSPNKTAFSDGTSWRYEANDATVTIS